MRPLTNSAFVVDFYRYKHAGYYRKMVEYLQHLQLTIPDYELQYHQMLAYFEKQKTLHKYSKFTLSGAMPSTLNTKSLQPVKYIWRSTRAAPRGSLHEGVATRGVADIKKYILTCAQY